MGRQLREFIKQSLGELTRALLPVNANIGFHFRQWGGLETRQGKSLGVWHGMVDMTRVQSLCLQDFK